MNLFQQGTFKLSSGVPSDFKIDCDALTDKDWQTLAYLVRKMVGPFASVEGVPTGGLKLAAALKPFANSDGPVLLVDDVLTTGRSMEKLSLLKYGSHFFHKQLIGAVVFARGPCPSWIKPLFTLYPELWIERGEGI